MRFSINSRHKIDIKVFTFCSQVFSSHVRKFFIPLTRGGNEPK